MHAAPCGAICFQLHDTMRSNLQDSSAVPALVPVSHEGIALPLKLLLPAFFSVAIVVVLPLLFSLYTSFTAYRLIEPETIWNFIGLRNYLRAFANEDFWAAFGRTVLFLTTS